jgi:hypothetical protein
MAGLLREKVFDEFISPEMLSRCKAEFLHRFLMIRDVMNA